MYILRHTSKLTLCPILAKKLLYVIVYSSLRYLIYYSYRQTTTLYLHRQSHMACNVRHTLYVAGMQTSPVSDQRIPNLPFSWNHITCLFLNDLSVLIFTFFLLGSHSTDFVTIGNYNCSSNGQSHMHDSPSEDGNRMPYGNSAEYVTR